MKAAVIGLGTMGMGAALSLAKAGHETWGCDLREAARAELEAAGGHAVGRAADLPADLEGVVLLVVNAAQVEDVLFGADGCIERLPAGAVVLLSVTMAPAVTRSLAARLEARGLLVLDAPVSGGFAAAIALASAAPSRSPDPANSFSAAAKSFARTRTSPRISLPAGPGSDPRRFSFSPLLRS